MRFSFRVFALGCLIGLVAGCGVSDNPVSRGEPIPDTQILSCADDLRGLAEPAGSLSGTLTVSASGTVLEGEVLWQASCPKKETDAETEFVLDTATLYRDDAGFPGDVIGSSSLELTQIVSCAARDTTQIGGTAAVEPLAPTAVVDLTALCAESTAMPTGSPLYAQVELTGHATTCSSDETDLLFRSKLAVECPPTP